MRKLIELDSVAAVEEVAARVVIPSSDTSLVILRRGTPGNDAAYEDPKVSDAEAWGRHALAANGFGDGAAVGDGAITDAPSARPTSYELYHAARAHCSFTLGEIIVALMQALAAFARQSLARHRQLKSPGLWGTKARLEELFGKTAQEICTTSREFAFRYRSPTHWIEVFRTYYGPMTKTFGALDSEKQAAFTQDLLALMESRNRSGDRTLVVPSEYLEVVITKK